MPGVPPDAVAQVKKGLRGLFSRRKSRQGQPQQSQPEATSTSQAAPSETNTAAAATESSYSPPPPQPASTNPNQAPQLSESSHLEAAKDIDLNPSGSSDVKTEPSQPLTDLKAEASKAPADVNHKPTQAVADTAEPPKDTSEPLKPGLTQSNTGMSATSGPLGDPMAEAYDYVDDGVEDVGPKGETLAKDETSAPTVNVPKVETSESPLKKAEEKVEEGTKA